MASGAREAAAGTLGRPLLTLRKAIIFDNSQRPESRQRRPAPGSAKLVWSARVRSARLEFDAIEATRRNSSTGAITGASSTGASARNDVVHIEFWPYVEIRHNRVSVAIIHTSDAAVLPDI